MQPAEIQILRDPVQAASMLAPLRMRILEALREPDSASGVARMLGIARQKVNYHLRELEAQRLVNFIEEQRKGNCVERVMQASARSYAISGEALGKLGEPALPAADRYSATYLVTAAARVIRDLAMLASRAARARKRIATLTLETEIRFASPEQRAACAEELAQFLARLGAKYHNASAPQGRTFRFVVGALPTITRKGEEEGSDAVFHA